MGMKLRNMKTWDEKPLNLEKETEEENHKLG